MLIVFILKGYYIGLAIAAPVGPIGVLCIHRTLNGGRVVGLLTGLGAATADALYGCIAGFGLTWVSGILISHQEIIRGTGGIFLFLLGGYIFFKKRGVDSSGPGLKGLSASYGSSFFLTLANPLTILSFTAVFAGLGLAETGGEYSTAGVLVLGVFLGSVSWWLILTTAAGFFRERLKMGGLGWLNRISGVFLVGAGSMALAGLV